MLNSSHLVRQLDMKNQPHTHTPQPTTTHRWGKTKWENQHYHGFPNLGGGVKEERAKPHRDMNSETTEREEAAARQHHAKSQEQHSVKAKRNGLQLGLNHLLGSRKKKLQFIHKQLNSAEGGI